MDHDARLQSVAPMSNDARRISFARMASIDASVVEIDNRLATAFPDYAAFANLKPLSVEDVQAQLGTAEALLLILDTQAWKPTPEETFIWVVTKTQMRWVRSNLGSAALAREVQALRCGLDYTAWRRPGCQDLTGQSYTAGDYDGGKLPPFDPIRSHRLYQALFGEVTDLINDKHLLIVPSGALTQLPFSVLVTAPAASGNKDTAWLARDHAITVLPAVSSLKALRATSHPSAAKKPLIGFGNPLLHGSGKHSPAARQARDKQACSKLPLQQVTGLAGSPRDAVLPMETRGGLADVAFIRSVSPLPETADEICAVAKDAGADTSEMRLGARATEHEVKRMSTAGDLGQYRVVHFATHGATAGQLKGSSEPGLILTPPEAASEDDDGYLSASEIAALKLDADWVILSACNTAAGQAQDAEALSGLARAFIYAQALALLVSHWEVDNIAAVSLITSAIRQIAQDTSLGRAEALRRAMRKLFESGNPRQAHPAIWAPFIVVGEGSR